MSRVEATSESPNDCGPAAPPDESDRHAGRAAGCPESEKVTAPATRYIDVETAELRLAVRDWQDAQKTRLAFEQRQSPAEFVALMATVEHAASLRLGRVWRAHPIYPWCKARRGAAGNRMALVVASIGDPRRFPGQMCSEGHYLPAIHSTGAPCPVVFEDATKTEACEGWMLAPRPGTGVRSLWHYLGLHVVDGKSPRRRKGVQADWNSEARAAILMKDAGLAAQIVRHSTVGYIEIYRAAKARLTEREQTAQRCESDHASGLLALNGSVRSGRLRARSELGALTIAGAAAEPDASEGAAGGLPPYRIDKIARTIAAKALIGDLLVHWKGLAT